MNQKGTTMSKANTAPKMKMATIQIPERLEAGILQIKHWIEAYTKSVRQPLTVGIGLQKDPGEIWIEEADNLNQDEVVALQNALNIINGHLIRHDDTWKAKSNAEKELRAKLLEIDTLFGQCE